VQGQVVGTYRDEGQKRHGFIRRNGIFTTFNVPNDHEVFGTVAIGINDIGQIVGNYVHEDDKIIPGTPPDIPDIPEHRHGFLRSSKGVFTTVDVPDADYTIAQGDIRRIEENHRR